MISYDHRHAERAKQQFFSPKQSNHHSFVFWIFLMIAVAVLMQVVR